jgi:hypothetical protein
MFVTGAAPPDLLAADVYALGVLLWQLWFRAAPYEGFDAARIVKHVKRRKRLPFVDAPGEAPIPASLRALIEACWAHEPEARPTAAAALARFSTEVAPAVLAAAAALTADARGEAFQPASTIFSTALSTRISPKPPMQPKAQQLEPLTGKDAAFFEMKLDGANLATKATAFQPGSSLDNRIIPQNLHAMSASFEPLASKSAASAAAPGKRPAARTVQGVTVNIPRKLLRLEPQPYSQTGEMTHHHMHRHHRDQS